RCRVRVAVDLKRDALHGPLSSAVARRCCLGVGFEWWRQLCPDPNGTALRLLYLERCGLANQIAELPIAVGARVEVGGDVRKALADRTQAHPTVLCLHLRNCLVQDGNGRTGRLKSLGRDPFLGRCRLRLGQQILGVDEPATRLPETLWGLLFAEPVDIGALFPEAGRKACEVAIRRNETEAVEPAAVQKVHGVDYQGDVGCVLPTRVGELLVRVDRVLREDLCPRFQALA